MSNIPPKYRYIFSSNKLVGLDGTSELTNDDELPQASLGTKPLINIQVINSSGNAYTGFNADDYFHLLVDADYANPAIPIPLGNSGWVNTTGSEYSLSLSEAPSSVTFDDVTASVGTIGALASGEWGYDSTLGKIHIRLSDDSDPSTQDDDYIECSFTVSGATIPFIQCFADGFNQTDTWYDTETETFRDPVITDGELTFQLNANTAPFYLRISTESKVSCIAEMQLYDVNDELQIIKKFNFLCLNRIMGSEVTPLELAGYPFYTKSQSDAKYIAGDPLSEGLPVGYAAENEDKELQQRLLSDGLYFVPRTEEPNMEATAMVVLEWDDTPSSDATYVLPMLAANGVKGVFNAITGKVGSSASFLSWAQLRAMQADGHEIASHMANLHDDHISPGITVSQFIEDLNQAKADFAANGITGVESFTYPGHESALKFRRIVPWYFRSARGRHFTEPNPYVPDLWELWSYNGDAVPLANLQTAVDQAEDEKKLLIIYHHNSDQTEADKVEDLIQYIQGKGIPIVTRKQALDRLGYLYSTGVHGYQDGTDFGSAVLFNGDARFNRMHTCRYVEINDGVFQYNCIRVAYALGGTSDAGDMLLNPATTVQDIQFLDANAAIPRRSSGSTSEVMDLGSRYYNFKDIIGQHIGGSRYYSTFHSAGDLQFYPGGTSNTPLWPATSIDTFRMLEESSFEFAECTLDWPDAPEDGYSKTVLQSTGDIIKIVTKGAESRYKVDFDWDTALPYPPDSSASS